MSRGPPGRVLEQRADTRPAVVLQQTHTRHVEVGVARHSPVEIRIRRSIAQYRVRVAVRYLQRNITYTYSIYIITSGSAMAEGPRDALVSRNSATTKYPYRMALFA